MGFVSISLVWAGIKTGTLRRQHRRWRQLVVKLVMLIIPLIFIVAGYLIYCKYIDKNVRQYKRTPRRGELHLDKEFDV